MTEEKGVAKTLTSLDCFPKHQQASTSLRHEEWLNMVPAWLLCLHSEQQTLCSALCFLWCGVGSFCSSQQPTKHHPLLPGGTMSVFSLDNSQRPECMVTLLSCSWLSVRGVKTNNHHLSCMRCSPGLFPTFPHFLFPSPDPFGKGNQHVPHVPGGFLGKRMAGNSSPGHFGDSQNMGNSKLRMERKEEFVKAREETEQQQKGEEQKPKCMAPVAHGLLESRGQKQWQHKQVHCRQESLKWKKEEHYFGQGL